MAVLLMHNMVDLTAYFTYFTMNSYHLHIRRWCSTKCSVDIDGVCLVQCLEMSFRRENCHSNIIIKMANKCSSFPGFRPRTCYINIIDTGWNWRYKLVSKTFTTSLHSRECRFVIRVTRILCQNYIIDSSHRLYAIFHYTFVYFFQ